MFWQFLLYPCGVIGTTCDLYSFLVGAGVTSTGHNHCDCRAVLVPQGGVGGQFAIHGV